MPESRGKEKTVVRGSAVDLATMAELEDRYDLLGVVNRVDDSVVALPNPVPVVVSGQLLAPARARVAGQGLNSSGKTLAVGLRSDRRQFLGGRTLDEDSISCHAVASP